MGLLACVIGGGALTSHGARVSVCRTACLAGDYQCIAWPQHVVHHRSCSVLSVAQSLLHELQLEPAPIV